MQKNKCCNLDFHQDHNIYYRAINSSFRKVTKKGAFPNENALLKLLYLRITELYKKWHYRPVPNWAMVRNQLDMDTNMQARIRKYQ
jgi:transposase-like protein